MTAMREVARWRKMSVGSDEIRRCLYVRELDLHNKAVARCNMPKRGLDYELMQKQRTHMAASLLSSLAYLVRQPAPALEAQP